MILDDIVKTKRREVAEAKAARPLRDLVAAAAGLPPARDFRAALAAGGRGCAIIAEVKRRSPSRGLFREPFDPAAIAREYERNGATAISVLTDATYFGGSGADLAAVKDAVALPVLRKEFIIDPYQIHETRALGADALLLIAAVLDDTELREYRTLGQSLGLAALVEVHDQDELERALFSGAEIVGINNRDLRNFETRLETTLRLAPLVPAGRIVVSESGIGDRRDIETVAAVGVRAFLIGETLVTAPDIGATLRGLLGR